MLGVVRLGGGKRHMGDGEGMHKLGGAGGQEEKGSLGDSGSPVQKTSSGKPLQSSSDMWLQPLHLPLPAGQYRWLWPLGLRGKPVGEAREQGFLGP